MATRYIIITVIEQIGRVIYFPIYFIMFLQKKELPAELLYETDFSDLGDHDNY